MLTEEVPVLEIPDQSDQIESPMPWRPLLRLSAVSMMAFSSMSVVTPTIKELVRDRFALDPREVSMFMLFHSLPQILLLGLVAGLFSDRWGRRLPLAIVGCIGTGITTLLLPFPETYSTLLILESSTSTPFYLMLMSGELSLTNLQDPGRVSGCRRLF